MTRLLTGGAVAFLVLWVLGVTAVLRLTATDNWLLLLAGLGLLALAPLAARQLRRG
jgi:hypothetical protein